MASSSKAKDSLKVDQQNALFRKSIDRQIKYLQQQPISRLVFGLRSRDKKNIRDRKTKTKTKKRMNKKIAINQDLCRRVSVYPRPHIAIAMGCIGVELMR